MINNDFQLLTQQEWMMLNAFILNMGQYVSVSEFCTTFLQMIKSIIPYDNAHFIFFDKNSSIAPLSFRININDKTNDEYVQYYNKIDDFFKKSFNTFLPKRSTDIMNYRKWENTEYFTDFHKKYFFHYVCILDIHYEEQLLSTLSLARDRKSIDFSDREVIYLKLLEPHIANHLYKLILIKNLKNSKLNEVIESSSRLYQLSDREIEIIYCVAKGYDNSQIADSLFISTETVKKHLNNIYKKCNVKNRTVLLTKMLGI